MTKQEQFQADLKRGKYGETLVCYFLKTHGRPEAELVVDDMEYWEKDIDIVCKDLTVEVKTDFMIFATGNMYIETDKDRGWLSKTQADELFYIDNHNEFAYVCRMNELRKYIKENDYKLKHTLKEGKCATLVNPDDCDFIIKVSLKNVWVNYFLMPYLRKKK